MASKKTPRPEWIDQLAADTIAELLEHAALRVERLEAANRGDRQPGQLTPALIAAIQDGVKAGLDALGAEAVDTYTATRKAKGTPARAAQGEELGPLLGLSQAGVFHSFGRRTA
jgi:N-acyl-D-aspartate/D-glutamate deacylase